MKLENGDQFAVGPGSVVALRNGRLVWVVAVDSANRFRGDVPLPPGVSAGSIVGLAADRMGLTILTRAGEVHLWSHNVKTWVASASLVEEEARR